MDSSRRPVEWHALRAFLIAPLVLAVIISAALSVPSAFGGFSFGLIYAVPITYAVTLVLGVPAYHFLAKYSRVTISRVLVLSAFIGLIAMPLLFEFTPVVLILGAAAGLMGGAIFVVAARGLVRDIAA